MTVHRNLGPNLREDTYQRDLELHLAEKGIDFEAQRNYDVYDTADQGTLIGYYTPILLWLNGWWLRSRH